MTSRAIEIEKYTGRMEIEREDAQYRYSMRVDTTNTVPAMEASILPRIRRANDPVILNESTAVISEEQRENKVCPLQNL